MTFVHIQYLHMGTVKWLHENGTLGYGPWSQLLHLCHYGSIVQPSVIHHLTVSADEARTGNTLAAKIVSWEKKRDKIKVYLDFKLVKGERCTIRACFWGNKHSIEEIVDLRSESLIIQTWLEMGKKECSRLQFNRIHWPKRTPLECFLYHRNVSPLSGRIRGFVSTHMHLAEFEISLRHPPMN